MIRYFMDSDDDGHWYLIPVEYQAAWDRWTGLDQDSPEAWDPPAWAVPLDGHPNGITFENPKGA